MPPSIIAPPRIKGTASGVAGNYTKLSIVGKGAFGDIFLCRDTKKGGEQLILKQVQTKGLKASEVRATKQETAVLNHVSHPYIIGYHDTFEDKGVVFIVMEYAAGGDLGRLIAKRTKEAPGGARFPESQIKQYARQLGSALEYLHGEVHLLHRDIKPKNVFLSGNGDVRLGDFGLSVALSKSGGEATKQVGTPLYMSPELAAGRPYDRSADIWAFGCTLYECMSFQPPWGELVGPDGQIEGGMKRLEKALQNNTLDVRALTSHYSEELCEMLMKLLAKRREERLPLSKLLEKLTEAPKVPASWGLSAEAQAALAAMHAVDVSDSQPETQATTVASTTTSAKSGGGSGGGGGATKPGASRASGARSSSAAGASSRVSHSRTSKKAPVPTVPLWGTAGFEGRVVRDAAMEDAEDDDDDVEDDDTLALGIEIHAAASVLQRSFKAKKKVNIMAPGDDARALPGDGLAGAPQRVPARPPNVSKLAVTGRAGSGGGAVSWGKGANATSAAPPSWGKGGGGGGALPSWAKGAASKDANKKPALKPSRVLRTTPSPRRGRPSSGAK